MSKNRTNVVILDKPKKEMTKEGLAFAKVRDNHRTNLDVRASDLRRKERMMVQRIKNAERQLNDITIARKIYEREKNRFNRTISDAKLESAVKFMYME